MTAEAQEIRADQIEPGSSMARVAAAADSAGLAIRIVKMAQSTRTAEEAASAAGCHVSAIVKSLIFRDRQTDRLVLVLVSGAHNADLDHLKSEFGLDLERADTRRVRDETGFAIGGVAPIGHLTQLPVYMDETLLTHAVVWSAAGRPDSVFSAAPEALMKAAAAETIRVTAN